MAMNAAQSSRLGRRLLHSSARLFAPAEPQVATPSASSSVLRAGASSSPSGSAPLATAVQPVVPLLPRRDIEIGPTQQSRYGSYYDASFSRDLLYMTYDHLVDVKARERKATILARQEERRSRHDWDPSSPYTQNRPRRPNKGNRPLAPTDLNYVDTVVELDRIVITSFSPESITNKQALIALVAIMRAITGKPVLESMSDPQVKVGNEPKTGYVTLVTSKKNVQAFKLRKGMPCGVKAVLPQKAAYDFLEVFTTFVLPRLRGFNGFALPPPSQDPEHASAISGVISLGMGPEAFGLFPQTEVNWDNIPFKAHGFQVDCITNQRGPRATEKARQLLSGLGVPFAHRRNM